ncbi:SusC/RagA family TonB-linked outer membrane protein [Pedobacter cryoconitis]|uniref:SusC/RagA family TonB-linked outer membrane protein n=1 Tax=Pedobacter cryoconitis TaxID=188932 RepID=UPI001C851FA2|nr:TonB-dependent receptor [Pedobacter cryoconitis]
MKLKLNNVIIQAMRFTFVLLTILCTISLLFPSFAGNGQVLNKRISVSIKHATIETAIRNLEYQSKVNFAYDRHLLDNYSISDFNFSNETLGNILKKLFESKPMRFREVNGIIVINALSKEEIKLQEPGRLYGKIADEKGLPLPGATLKIAELGKSVQTDEKGNYKISAPAGTYTIEASYISYENQQLKNIQLKAGETTTMDIKLSPAKNGLNEVVVVGYGTQKKVNLTGAVSQVDAKVFEDRPVAGIAQALQGAIPNLNITFGDGQPGSPGKFNVRGFASITNVSGSPLILIDGIPGDVNMINPHDVENVTVLKDAASAAIYGARAAFGVILITTKKAAEGKISVNYGSNFSLQKVTTKTDFITDGYTQMRLVDEAFSRNVGNSYSGYNADDYAQLKLRQTDKTLPSVVVQNRNGQDQYSYYGNTDWWNFLFKKDAPAMEHYINVTGGDKKVDFLLSGRYYQQKGLFQSYLREDVYNAYNFRAKINAHLSKWLTVFSNTQFAATDYTYPGNGYKSDGPGFYNHAMAAYVPQNPDGTFTYRTNLNNYGANEYANFQNKKSFGGTKNYDLTNTIGFNANIVPGLIFTGNYAYQLRPSSNFQRQAVIPWSINPGIIKYEGNDKYKEGTDMDQHHSVNLYATYEKKIKENNFKVTAGYNYELQKYKTNTALRFDLLSKDLNQIDLGTGAQQATGSASEWALLGYFGRINYDYKGKYLLELNGRYDGTSRFPEKSRFGFFPSISGGWRISEESFFEALKPAVSEFKLRASYGTLGNQDVGTGSNNLYPYIPVMNSTLSKWVVNGNQTQTLSSPNPIVPDFTWEKSTSLNFGADMAFFNNRLQTSLDIYRRKTTDMLINGKTLPSVYGADSPKQNAGDLLTKGWDISVSWKDSGTLMGKPFGYNFGVVLSDYTAKITKFDNPNNLLSNFYVGQELGEIWGYSIDGYFKSDQEAQNWKINQDYVDGQRTGSPGEWSKLHAGDLKFKDLNGDGVINDGKNTLQDHGDLRKIGNSLPRYSFGINAGFNWSNFDLSVSLQGIGKQDWYPNTEAGMFWGTFGRPYSSFIPKDFESKLWSPENPDSYFPINRGYAAYDGGELYYNNDKYLQNIAYLRLKNLTVGYNLPASIIKKWKIEKLRFFFTGQNMLTLTKLKTKYIDPEQLTPDGTDKGGRAYPFMKTYTLGLNVTF